VIHVRALVSATDSAYHLPQSNHIVFLHLSEYTLLSAGCLTPQCDPPNSILFRVFKPTLKFINPHVEICVHSWLEWEQLCCWVNWHPLIITGMHRRHQWCGHNDWGLTSGNQGGISEFIPTIYIVFKFPLLSGWMKVHYYDSSVLQPFSPNFVMFHNILCYDLNC